MIVWEQLSNKNCANDLDLTIWTNDIFLKWKTWRKKNVHSG